MAADLGPVLVLLAVVFAATLAQSLVGFGSAMIAMGVLTPLLGLATAAPLVALVAATLEAVVLLRYRAALNWRAVWQLVLGSVVGIPIGMFVVTVVNERMALAVLGGVICGYVVYAWLGRKPPLIAATPAWTYGTGLLAGALGGAYNTSAPPVILYGECRRWSPDEFRGNLQGFFLANDAFIVLAHAGSGNLNRVVWTNYALALPAIAAALWLGLRLAPRLDAARLRQATLVLLMVIGLKLVWGQ
jgi:uncharacterized protein